MNCDKWDFIYLDLPVKFLSWIVIIRIDQDPMESWITIEIITISV